MSVSVWFWLIVGLLLILFELIVPGLVIVFLGIGALLTALLNWIGVIDTWHSSIVLWMVSSFTFLIGLRGVVKKYLPGEVSKNYIDEDDEAFGAIVEVVEDVNPEKAVGRIKFRGSTWPAKSIEGEIKAGAKAKIVFRHDMTWIIESADYLPEVEQLDF